MSFIFDDFESNGVKLVYTIIKFIYTFSVYF